MSIIGKIVFISSILIPGLAVNGQVQVSDSLKEIPIGEVVVTANRLPVMLQNNPGSVSMVTSGILSLMPKTAAVDEALRLVPGVRIDNQHDGERVHVSIRGQGILTERGLRGIGVIIDGIPVNDPSGFAPDLYDVEWAAVNRIEVLRGPAAGLYGGGGAAGVINIHTINGAQVPLGGEFIQSAGSNGFRKSFIQSGGANNNLNYQLSLSRTGGDGYRDHQAFRGDKLYEKISFHPSSRFNLIQIISHSDYFQQNPEGLNIGQFNNLKQANPDANPFNEYQKTNRTTIGITGKYQLTQMEEIEATSYLRSWKYKETSNKAAEYRDISNPGFSIQYSLTFKTGKLKNNICTGTDLKWQNISMYKLQSASSPLRKESIDDANLETGNLLANQLISQRSEGIFALYSLEAGKFNMMGNFRYDEMINELTDKLPGAGNSETRKDFSKTSLRIGASYNIFSKLTLYANWSQGFMPPSTEELASNPTGYSGFNTHLVPAESGCFETGFRGSFSNNFYYDITGFFMKTKNDFFRFKQTGRGNQEVFYGNAGNSERKGIETFFPGQF